MTNTDFTSTIKIICTIGPATWDENVMREIINKGMNVARINAAFADTSELIRVQKLVRSINPTVALMLDIKGPEVRLNKFPEPIALNEDTLLEIGSDSSAQIYPITYPQLYTKLKLGQRILVGDGEVALEVVEIKLSSFIVKPVYGELLKPGKALNVPGVQLSDNPLTERDLNLLKVAIENEWEFVSASFIRNKADAQLIKDHLTNSNMQLIAKIEDGEGVRNIAEIIDVVDGIMIARGGLGVELGIEKVPVVQRILTREALLRKIPVITATQMLESMIYNPVPTRAEANDVATAVISGSDSIMLSGESSAGKYPVLAVSFMQAVNIDVNKALKANNLNLINEHGFTYYTKPLALHTSFDEEFRKHYKTDLKAIVIYSPNGKELNEITNYYLTQPRIAIVKNQYTANQLNIVKGLTETFNNWEESNSQKPNYTIIKEDLKSKNIYGKVLLISTSNKGTFLEILSVE